MLKVATEVINAGLEAERRTRLQEISKMKLQMGREARRQWQLQQGFTAGRTK
jgi:hypothetical protein